MIDRERRGRIAIDASLRDARVNRDALVMMTHPQMGVVILSRHLTLLTAVALIAAQTAPHLTARHRVIAQVIARPALLTPHQKVRQTAHQTAALIAQTLIRALTVRARLLTQIARHLPTNPAAQAPRTMNYFSLRRSMAMVMIYLGKLPQSRVLWVTSSLRPVPVNLTAPLHLVWFLTT